MNLNLKCPMKDFYGMHEKRQKAERKHYNRKGIP